MKLPRRTFLHETSMDHNPRAFFRTAALACVAVGGTDCLIHHGDRSKQPPGNVADRHGWDNRNED